MEEPASVGRELYGIELFPLAAPENLPGHRPPSDKLRWRHLNISSSANKWTSCWIPVGYSSLKSFIFRFPYLFFYFALQFTKGCKETCERFEEPAG